VKREVFFQRCDWRNSRVASESERDKKQGVSLGAKGREMDMKETREKDERGATIERLAERPNSRGWKQAGNLMGCSYYARGYIYRKGMSMR
jgi:hypothetical protein